MHLRNVLSLALMLAVLVAASCGSGKRQSAETDEVDTIATDTLASADAEADTLTEYEEMVEELSLQPQRTEAFVDFFFSFLNNRRFQAERVKFPLSVTDINSERFEIRSGKHFRSYFAWPSAEEYYLLLNDEEQMEAFQNDVDLSHAEVQLINLDEAVVRAFEFERAEHQWFLEESYETYAHGSLGEFLNFYNRFSTDSIFQQTRLANPLRFSMPDPDDDYGTIDGTLEPYQWPSFRPDMPMHQLTNILFGQQLEGARQIILMRCGIANGLLNVFTFRYEGGRWRLVSFKL